jgi:hypothetical protein
MVRITLKKNLNQISKKKTASHEIKSRKHCKNIQR